MWKGRGGDFGMGWSNKEKCVCVYMDFFFVWWERGGSSNVTQFVSA